MNYKKHKQNPKIMKSILSISVLLHICFIALSIYNILTKDSLIAISLSIFSLMIFTSMLTLFANTYMIHKNK